MPSKPTAAVRLISRLVLGTMLAIGLSAAETRAAPVDWTLQDLTFTDGATAAGTFEINTYGYLSPNWNIVTGNGAITGWTYGPSINALISGGETVVDFNRTGYDGYLQLAFANPLTAGPTDPLNYANSYECNGFQSLQGTCTGTVRFFNPNIAAFISDAAADFPVPEPASLAILGAGLAAMGMTRLRRLR
jgi:hypothetical protein